MHFVMICIATLFLCFVELNGRALAEVIFQETFDKQADWYLAQPSTATSVCFSGCNVPSGWSGYYNGFSYCQGKPGNNTIILDATNAFGGGGKGLTFWDESCTDAFEDSDGNLGKVLDKVYPEVYLRFFIKFSPTFKWNPVGSAPHKLAHLQYYCGSGSPWSYFGNTCNMPVNVPGIKTYDGDVYYYVGHRCETNYYCQGTPSYKFDVGTDLDHVRLGPWASTLGDGNWHSMEFYFKMNTNSGTIFNADGVHRFWLDGVLKHESTTIPFSDNGSIVDPRHGWNFFSIGGNNKNRWTKSCSGTECEQWYSIDDIVISTSYIGPETNISPNISTIRVVE